MNRKYSGLFLKIVWNAAALLLLSGIFTIRPALATEIRIPALKAAPGQQIEVPVVIDRIDNLAGMKLVIGYDKKVLTYKSTVKAKEAASLIHIVNDKRPGTLIVVMAGARGIKGENLAIVTITFEVAKNAAQGSSHPFYITESQLMSDKLKDIRHQVKTFPLEIVKGGKTQGGE